MARYHFVLVFGLLLHHCFFISAAESATYYVAKDSTHGTCDDSSPGTLGEPWCTIDKANATLQPGDTVFIRAGTYTTTAGFIQPRNSGSSHDARITYKNYTGEKVIFQGTTYGIRLRSVSFITVEGITFKDCGRNIYMDYSSQNHIGYCRFENPGGPVTWAGSRLYNNSTHNRIYNCTFTKYGKESYYSGSYQDSGCILDIGNDNDIDNSDYNLVVNNTFYHGGHHILGVYANYNVVRNNTFHNEEWYDCHRSNIGGKCGNRNVILNTSYPENNIRNVIEDNYIVFSGVPPDQDTSAGLGIRTKYNILRRNVFYYCDGAGVSLTSNSGNHNGASNNYIYNNVFYRNGYPLVDDWNPRKTGLMIARWVDNSSYNQITNVAIKNNIFYENQLYAIYYYYVNKNDMIVENNWEEAGDPKFIDLTGQADPFDFTVFDFRLQPDSPCKDNGGFLTRTKNGGNNSTEVKVEDAGYFIDGFGITNGDEIQFEGQTQKARIVSIDYNTNTLHLESTMSWASGVGVSLPYSGSRPDQGVYEYSDSVCLADLEPDGDVDEDDLNTLTAGFGKTSVAKDTDGDGDMDGADLSKMAVDFGRTDCFP